MFYIREIPIQILRMIQPLDREKVEWKIPSIIRSKILILLPLPWTGHLAFKIFIPIQQKHWNAHKSNAKVRRLTQDADHLFKTQRVQPLGPVVYHQLHQIAFIDLYERYSRRGLNHYAWLSLAPSHY